jgi:hypothetical protein
MKGAVACLLVLSLGACGGPLAGARLVEARSAQGRVLMSLTFPALERTDGVIRGWSSAGPEEPALRELLFNLYDVAAPAARLVASDRPVGVAVLRADQPGGPPEAVNAIAFTVRDPEGTRHWLESVGAVEEHTGPFYLVRPGRAGQGIYPGLSGGRPSGTLWFHVDGEEVLLSRERGGLLHAGLAARDAAHAAGEDLLVQVHPRAWTPERRQAVAVTLAGFGAFLRHGRAGAQATPQSLALNAREALFYLGPLARVDEVDFAITVGKSGAALQARAPAVAGEPALAPLPLELDRSLGGARPAALGVLDCRGWLGARQRLLISAWKATGGVGADELGRLSDAEEQALSGACSFAARTDDDVWSDEASYPLRAGASPGPLTEALAAALRSGGLPNLHAALDELPTAKLLFSRSDEGVLALDRVLGRTDSLETRHAAALHGGGTLRERFTVRDGRLRAVAGARADERLDQQLAHAAASKLPAELEQALGGGRGRGGFVFLDLAALWKPALRAAQVIQAPLAEVVARNPTLLQERRPLVLTLEPGPGLDANVSMPPSTFQFLLLVTAMLFGG